MFLFSVQIISVVVAFLVAAQKKVRVDIPRLEHRSTKTTEPFSVMGHKLLAKH